MAAVDVFQVFEQTAPPGAGRKGKAIAPSDTDELEFVCRYLWVGQTGNLNVVDQQGNSLLFENVPVGWFDHLLIRQVKLTDTTATKLIAVQ